MNKLEINEKNNIKAKDLNFSDSDSYLTFKLKLSDLKN